MIRTNESESTLFIRVEKLERQNRWMRAILTYVLLGGAGVVLLAAKAADEHKTIEATQIILRDKEGNKRVVLRTISVDVIGRSNATITARVTVDGTTTTIEKSLPARFEYQAKTVLLDIVGPQSTSDDYIEATLRVNDVEQGMCRDLAIRIGYKGPGLLGLGSKKMWCSGITSTELAAN